VAGWSEEDDSAPPWEDDASRGTADLLLGVLAGSALAPFLQVLPTRTGEDAYAKLKDLLSRRRRKTSTPGPDEDAVLGNGTVQLADPEQAIVLELPHNLADDTEAEGLTTVAVPRRRPGQWVLLRREPTSRRWQAVAVDAPLPGAIEVEVPRGSRPAPSSGSAPDPQDEPPPGG
jgi:hypothetical protein